MKASAFCQSHIHPQTLTHPLATTSKVGSTISRDINIAVKFIETGAATVRVAGSGAGFGTVWGNLKNISSTHVWTMPSQRPWAFCLYKHVYMYIFTHNDPLFK